MANDCLVSTKDSHSPVDKTKNITERYDAMATKYDDIYEYRREYTAELAIKWLKIEPDDNIADIGGGTGSIAETIKQKCPRLQSDILVVDPSAESLKLAQKKKGVSVLLADVDQFLASTTSTQYNKYFFSTSHHHIPDQQKSFRTAYKQLPIEGTIIILYYPVEYAPPLWKKAKEHRQKLFDPLFAHTVEYLQNAGFTVTDHCPADSEAKPTVHFIDKEELFYKIRNRISSCLDVFSDEEIETGIEEMKQMYKDTNCVIVDQVTYVIKAVK